MGEYICLVVSNIWIIFQFIYGIIDLPIDELHFSRWLSHHQPVTYDHHPTSWCEIISEIPWGKATRNGDQNEMDDGCFLRFSETDIKPFLGIHFIFFLAKFHK